MVRKAKIGDVQAIQNLIRLYSEDGKMLFRSFQEIEQSIAELLFMKKRARS